MVAPMDDAIIYLIVIVVSLFAGWKAREMYAMLIVANILRKYDSSEMFDENAPQASNLMPIDIEKHSDAYYVYNGINSSFITQVRSKEEMFEYFKNFYPNKTVILKKEHFALFEKK